MNKKKKTIVVLNETQYKNRKLREGFESGGIKIIKNKMNKKKKTSQKELEIIVRRIMIEGYEMGKKQNKTPYKYTLDTDKGEKHWKLILKWHEKHSKETYNQQVERTLDNYNKKTK